MKVYLAGPDIFLADAVDVGRAKKAICAAYGLDAFWPLDQALSGESPMPLWRRIFDNNRRAIAACDAVVANLSPFRGLSADVGTALEVGAAEALGKLVFGYSNESRSFEARIAADPALAPARELDGRLFAADGMEIERFGTADNLMTEGAIAASGGAFLMPPAGEARALGDLRLFETCVERLALALKTSPRFVEA